MTPAESSVSPDRLLSLDEQDAQGFSGWAKALLTASEAECERLFSTPGVNWGERAGETLVALRKNNRSVRVDEPMFARRALNRNKMTPKQFQAACSTWSLALDFQRVADERASAPSLALLALARVKLWPAGAALSRAIATPFAESLPADFIDAPALALAFNHDLSPLWFDALFDFQGCWSVPAKFRDRFRGASHATHLAVDAMARRHEKAPLEWCFARGSSFTTRDANGRSCVERLVALHWDPQGVLGAITALAEMGAPFEERTLQELSRDVREIIDPILLARSERRALGAQIAHAEIEKDPSPRAAPKRL